MQRLTGTATAEANGIYKGKNAHVEKGTAYLKNTAFTINDLSGNATMLVQKAINLLARFEDIGETPEVLADVAAREDNIQEALERIRSMSDEELAKFIYESQKEYAKHFIKIIGWKDELTFDGDYSDIIEWLKQEVSE